MTLPTPDTTGLVGAGSPYPCSIGGRQYIIDLSDKNQFIERTIPLLKNQFIGDTKSQVSTEASLNPEDLVRRGFDSWHLGGGQTYYDRPESLSGRFNSSTGIDPWTKWQLSLLPATRSIKALTTNIYDGVCSVGNYLYLADGQTIYFTNTSLASGAPTWTAVTGTPAVSITSICTDGYHVYAGYGANGVYTTTAGAAAATSLFTGTVNKVMYIKDRLYTLNGGGVLTNPTNFAGPIALPAALLDKGNTFIWTCGGEGVNHSYFGGYFQDHSYIFKTAVKPDGTALDTPTLAGTLPDGETITSMCGYLGYLLIGTSLTAVGGATTAGVRLAQIQSDGNLVLGPRSDATGVGYVFCFEPQDRFVWFTWTESSTESGLGRIDLSRFVDDLKPAVTKDVQFIGTGLSYVTGVTTHLGRRVFRVDGQNLAVTDDANLAATGDIYFGKVAYGLQDSKVAMFVDVDMLGTANSNVTVYVAADGGARTSYGTLTASGTIDLSALSGKEFEVSLRLARDSVAPSTGPTIKKVTLRSFINATRTREFIVPVIIRPRISTMTGQDVYYTDVRAEIDAINAMVGTVVVWKYGTKTEYVQIKDYEWHPDYFDTEAGQFGGVCTVKMQAVHV